MSEIDREIGKRIRCCRKMRHMTLAQLACRLGKGTSTVGKYETGEISLDVNTLYALAAALQVQVEQLLYLPPNRLSEDANRPLPAFFQGLSRFYSYLFDGRSNQLIRCVFDILHREPDGRCKIVMYMNFSDYETCQNCENTYLGYLQHFDALSVIMLTNQDTPMEKAQVQILASYLDSDTKWGLWTGFSSRPMMPIATKMLFSKKRLSEEEALIQKLKISKEDIRLLKLYNMLPVT